ncbi:PTS system, fructose-specific IIC component/PTS system, nitrogen regulatory IIA component [Verrucomicrobium sp. GAS474]|uniref:PTS sugar transporter subunit IIA n=1 Tax=Verrucomicrobium sp. GAS474 TaxID=1882831 RepID=UPI00087B5B84|nr:PTS sugar transporter subunit IIA [Verrucomicrobium sp. GAS474]SDU04510.1 PTS system, fructose-specific IIC component/PTS system, nitrogen regulatory IIA component [Verrucomicrobium sp. GAS474]
MLISDLLKTGQVNLQLKSTDGTGAIKEVAELLRDNPAVTSFDGFYEELEARERVETTCLGNGIAFPHARTDHIKTMVLAVGRSVEGIHFKSCNQIVHLLFTIGTPKRMATDYLSVVGGLARILKDPKLREALMSATQTSEFVAIIAAAEKKV